MLFLSLLPCSSKSMFSCYYDSTLYTIITSDSLELFFLLGYSVCILVGFCLTRGHLDIDLVFSREGSWDFGLDDLSILDIPE